MATQRIPHLILLISLLLTPFLFSGCIIEGCDCEDEIAATYGHYGEPEEMESNREDNEYEMTLRYIALGFEKVFTWGDEMERCCYEDTKTITDDDDGDDDEDSLSLAISTAELTNDNDADGEIGSGDMVTYTVTATNTGDADQDNVEVSVTEPTTDSETCATVAQDETCVLDYSYTVTQSDVDAGSIVVEAEAKSDQITTSVTDTETTSLSGNGGGGVEFELTLAISGEKLTNDDGDGLAEEGEDVTFTVAAENTGTAAQSDVIITVTGPTGTTPQDKTCATLASGDTCSDNFEYELSATDIAAKNITVEVEVTSNEVATETIEKSIVLADLSTADQSLVPEINYPPLPISQKVYPQLIEPKEIELSAIDPNGDPMTFKIRTAPTNGTLNPAFESEMGIFVYTPSLYAGDQTEDSFTFVANDGALDSEEAIVKIIIGNQPPKAVDTTIELLVDPGNEVLLQMRGSDLNGDLLTYELMDTSGITSGALKIDQFNAEYGTIPYVLGKGTYEVEFTFKVIDSEGAESGVGTVTITVSEPEVEA